MAPTTTASDLGALGNSNSRTTANLARSAAERGTTHIDDSVVSVIARMAAQRVPGIHRIGESSLRGILSRIGGKNGITAEVGLRQAAVDLEIAVEFGYPIAQVAADLRERIIEAVETMTGREVVEVNLFVTDVHIPGESSQRRNLE